MSSLGLGGHNPILPDPRAALPIARSWMECTNIADENKLLVFMLPVLGSGVQSAVGLSCRGWGSPARVYCYQWSRYLIPMGPFIACPHLFLPHSPPTFNQVPLDTVMYIVDRPHFRLRMQPSVLTLQSSFYYYRHSRAIFANKMRCQSPSISTGEMLPTNRTTEIYHKQMIMSRRP